jgi:hypothetical protein
MGLNPSSRKAGERRLADMSAPAEPEETYKCPADAIEEGFQFDLGEGSYLVARLYYLDWRVVWFTLVQYYKPWPTVEPVCVARIDCCHGVVHEHRFNKAGEDVLDHRPIRAIPVEGGELVVHDVYEEAYKLIFDRWEANLEGWLKS